MSSNGFAEGDTDTEWTAKLLQLQELQLDPIDVHLLGQLVGLQFPESNLRYLSGDQVLVGTFQAVRKLIGGLCRDRFVVLALENFEYVDAYSAELAAELLRSLKDDRLLLVVTQPTGSALPFPEDQPLDRVELPPMGKKECEGFISGLLGVHSVPRPLVDLVYKSSGGNALFAKEILGQLLQEGKIRVEVESVVVEGKLSRAGIPATASDLIASRIDALNADQRLVLESAAVVGRSFSQALLSEVVQLDAEAIVPVLSALADLKLVRSAREEDQLGPDVHVFRNDLSWEVCIRGLLDARARELHNRIGEAIERVYAKGLSPYFEELSRHYEAGGLHRRAASFAEQAGQTFARQYYNREALRCFQRAIHLLQTAPTSPSEERAVSAHLSDLYLRIGKIHSREIKNPEAERSYMLALDYAGEAEDASLTAQALVKVAESQVELGKLDAAGPYLSQALAEAKRLGDTALYIDASEERARWAIRGGDFELCGTVLAEALELAQSLGDLNRVARVHDLLGDFAMRTGAFERSLEHLRSGRDAALKTEDRILQGRLMNNLGVAYVHSGQLEDALRCYERACELRQDIEYRRGVIINLHNIGDVLLRQGEMERAYQYFDESLELARALGWLGGQAMNQVYLGFLQEWRGEEGGTLVLEEAIEDAKTSGVSDAVAQGKVFLARLAERRGDQELCDSLLVEAETLGTSGLVDLGAWNALSAEANGGSPGHRPPDPVA